MIMPVKTFKSPVNTDIRLYKIDGEYYVPENDIVSACGYAMKSSGTANRSRVNMAFQKNHSKNCLRAKLFNRTNTHSWLKKIDDVVSILKTALNIPKGPPMLARISAEQFNPKIKAVIELFEEEILPYVELLKNDEVEKAAQAFGLDSQAEKLTEEIPTLFASRVEEDKVAKIAALKAEIAILKALLAQKEKSPQLIFAERMQAKMLKKHWKIGDLAKHAGINSGTLAHVGEGARALKLPDAVNVADALNVSLDWLCGRDEYVKE